MPSRAHRLAGVLVLLFLSCGVGSDRSTSLPEPSPTLGPEARARFERASGGSSDLVYEYARWLHAHGAFGDAAIAYGRCLGGLKDAGRIATPAWLRALALDQAGLDATAALSEARNLASGFAPVWRLSSERALDRGETENALGFAQRAAALDAGDPMARVLVARAYRASNRFQDAEQAVSDALRIDPDHSAARHLRGVIALERGQADAAIWLSGNAIRRSDVSRDPTYREVLELSRGVEGTLARAEGLAAAGKVTAALAILEPLVVAGEKSIDLLVTTADLRFRTGKRASAVELWRLVASRPDASAMVYERLSTIAMDDGDLEGALSSAELALQRDAGCTGALLVRGAVQCRRGKPDAALSDLRRVHRLRPEWEVATIELVGALRQAAARVKGGIDSEAAKALLNEADALLRVKTRGLAR